MDFKTLRLMCKLHELSTGTIQHDIMNCQEDFDMFDLEAKNWHDIKSELLDKNNENSDSNLDKYEINL